MITMVGTQNDFEKALINLVELDYAAIAAYEDAIKYLKNADFKEKLNEFKGDHERHIKELSEVIAKHGQEAPTSAGPKELLTSGKVLFAQLIGDKAILRAMKSNEDDTNTAYERMTQHAGKSADATAILDRGLQDERKHRAWLEQILATLD